MKNIFRFALAVVVSFVFASMAMAQPEDESQLGLSYILGLGGMAEELELSQDQAVNLDGLWFKVQDDFRQAFIKYSNQRSNNLTDEQRTQLNLELAESVKKIRDEEMKRIKDVLFDHQLKRLEQIRYQYLKRNTDGMKAIGSDLELTDAQFAKVKSVAQSIATGMKELQLQLRDQSISRNEFQEQVSQLREQAKKDLMAILTPAQARKLNELEGEPYEFDARKRREQKEKKEKESDGESDRSPEEKGADDGVESEDVQQSSIIGEV